MSETFGQLCARVRREGVWPYFKQRFASQGGKDDKVSDDFGETAANLARDILSALGYAQSPSMEPGQDERRDRVARLIEPQIARLRAENEQLTRWLQTRDLWIVEKGLWPDFTRDVETNANHIDALRAENERLAKERDDAYECLTIAYMQGAASVRERARSAEAEVERLTKERDEARNLCGEAAETIARAREWQTYLEKMESDTDAAMAEEIQAHRKKGIGYRIELRALADTVKHLEARAQAAEAAQAEMREAAAKHVDAYREKYGGDWPALETLAAEIRKLEKVTP